MNLIQKHPAHVHVSLTHEEYKKFSCPHKRYALIRARCKDMCNVTYTDENKVHPGTESASWFTEYEGYPVLLADNDNVLFLFCLDCGQILDETFPMKEWWDENEDIP